MQWPAWDTFTAGEALLDCSVSASSDFKKLLVKAAKLLRWTQKQIDEMETGVWFEPVRTFFFFEENMQ